MSQSEPRLHTFCMKHWIPLLLCCAMLVCNAGETLQLRLTGTWESDKGSVAPLLQSVAREFLPLFKNELGRDGALPVIEVEQKGGPITLFKRGPKGEIRVKLDSAGTLWSQYSFQFAHELGHILCRYDDDTHRNKWFEESICEMASLFALRRMTETWKTQPPFSNWKDYGPSLHKYAEDRIQKARLPAGVTLAAWYAERAEAFSKNATERDNNLVIANALLPYFEEQPERWAAVWFLNVETCTPAFTFADYLPAWRKNTPKDQQGIVDEVAKRLGVAL